jgi:adenosylcobinamide-GDP ribazoletransferase
MMLNSFFLALSFLTRIPIPRREYTTKNWQQSVAYYPLVGVLLGFLLMLWAMALTWALPLPVAAILVLIAWVYLTGGIHLDGWMDLADGFASGRPQAEMLQVMKDSRVGAMGAIAAILLLLLKAVLIYELLLFERAAWLVLPILFSRAFLVWIIWIFPYLSEHGLGQGLREGLQRIPLTVGSMFTLLIIWLMYTWVGLLLIIPAALAGLCFVRLIRKRLGGITGDGYGATVEWTETCILLLIITGERWL